MSKDNEFVTYVLELMNPVADVQAKRMFGGHGFFRDGLMFALEADGELYLKADKQSQAEFERQECEPFVYYKNDKPFTMSYYHAPEHIFEEPEQMLYWANLAFDAALRAKSKKR